MADEEDKYDSHENGCKVLLSSAAATTSPLSPAAVMAADPAPVAVGRAAAAGAGNLKLRGGEILGKCAGEKERKFNSHQLFASLPRVSTMRGDHYRLALEVHRAVVALLLLLLLLLLALVLVNERLVFLSLLPLSAPPCGAEARSPPKDKEEMMNFVAFFSRFLNLPLLWSIQPLVLLLPVLPPCLLD